MPYSTQIINGREYAYEYKSVWNKEKQRSEQKRDYLGRIIDGEFVPKDLIEKAFTDLKDRLNMRRTSVLSEENMEGKLFLQFIGLIFLSYVKQAMDKAGLFKNYTMQELFDELDVIELYQQPGSAAFYGEITEKQRNLYTAFGVTPPS